MEDNTKVLSTEPEHLVNVFQGPKSNDEFINGPFWEPSIESGRISKEYMKERCIRILAEKKEMHRQIPMNQDPMMISVILCRGAGSTEDEKGGNHFLKSLICLALVGPTLIRGSRHLLPNLSWKKKTRIAI